MKVGKMLKNGIEVTAYIRAKNGIYYGSLVYDNAAGKRRDKSFPTKLREKGNKKNAEKMARAIKSGKDIEIKTCSTGIKICSVDKKVI